MVLIAAHNIISPLGLTSAENFAAILANNSAIKEYPDKQLDGQSLWASKLDSAWDAEIAPTIPAFQKFTKFEKLVLASITEAASNTSVDISSAETILILSTTKGNISLLEGEAKPTADLVNRLNLFASAALIAQHFANSVKPLVISNACISGLNALLIAKRLLDSGQYRNAVVVGADTISQFVYSGFYSFQALTNGTCKPFSADRTGINLGEAAATIILTRDEAAATQLPAISIAGGAITNDANHLSGPSRTGRELSIAIQQALTAAKATAEDIGFISAHGTATIYNDEMEGKAFALAGLSEAPINSIKGAIGHTLGAAGIVESVLVAISLQTSTLIPTVGFSVPMPELKNKVLTAPTTKPTRYGLKTASGFGGCNGALVFERLQQSAT